MLPPLPQDLTSALLDGSLRAALPIALLFTVYAVYPVWCALALRKLMRYAAGASASALVLLTRLSAFANPSKGLTMTHRQLCLLYPFASIVPS